MQPMNPPQLTESHKQQQFHIGQNLDVLDSVNKWMNVQVRFVGNGTIYVHYSGWSAKYDQSISITSNRILKQWQPGNTIRVNNRIDVYHPNGGWLEARVIQIQNDGKDVDLSKCRVKAHFYNYHHKYDMWVSLADTNQVTIIGSKSKGYGMGKNRKKQKLSKLSELITKILQQKTKNLKQRLSHKNLVIIQSGGDGNCLFRSISSVLYGCQSYHKQIRKICMDYISYQKDFYQDYIAQDIDEYIQMKKQDGQWGDDVEIQALSQIYGRPIQIYVFDDKPIRTFHEENQNHIQPLRLNYVGGCHYNSIKFQDKVNEGLMSRTFGEYQQLFFSTYKAQMGSIIRNRNLFSNCNRIEDTIGQQIQAQQRSQTKIQDQLSRALQISQTQAMLQQIQDAQLKQFQSKYQQQKLHEQLKRLEQKQLEQAKKLSQQQHPIQQQPQLAYQVEKPYWFDGLKAQGFADKQIWFAIEIKGMDPDAVQNFLLDNIY